MVRNGIYLQNAKGLGLRVIQTGVFRSLIMSYDVTGTRNSAARWLFSMNHLEITPSLSIIRMMVIMSPILKSSRVHRLVRRAPRDVWLLLALLAFMLQ